MKVRELIEKLQQMDPELPVVIRSLHDNGEFVSWWEYRDLDSVSLKQKTSSRNERPSFERLDDTLDEDSAVLE